MDLTQIGGVQVFTYGLEEPRTVWLANIKLE